MDKLVEREAATRNPLVAAPALAVQFFLIPLAVVGITVLVYIGFRSLLTDDRTAAGLPGRDPERRHRPPVAGGLRAVAADGRSRRSAATARWPSALVKAFDDAKDDDPRVRRYLALAIGRLDPPLPREAVDALLKSLNDPENRGRPTSGRDQRLDRRDERGAHQHDLGARLVRRPGGRARRCSRSTTSPDAGHPQDGGVRARRAAGRRADRRRCGRRSQDAAPDVRWNAAVALARHGSRDGVPVLRQMLDRAYVEQTVKRDVRAGRRPGSGRRRDDQRPARGGGAEGRRRSGRRSRS